MEDPKPADFEFDALPGDKPAAGEPATDAPKEGKKRGPKKGSKRKVRGPRRVAPQEPIAEVATIITNTPRAGESLEATLARTDRRKTRKVSVDPPELTFIQLMMHLNEKQRERVLHVLNKVFRG